MHYKNGRPVEIGDQVLQQNYNDQYRVGVVLSVRPHLEECSVSVLFYGHNDALPISSQELIHCDDAYQARWVVTEQLLRRSVPGAVWIANEAGVQHARIMIHRTDENLRNIHFYVINAYNERTFDADCQTMPVSLLHAHYHFDSMVSQKNALLDAVPARNFAP